MHGVKLLGPSTRIADGLNFRTRDARCHAQRVGLKERGTIGSRSSGHWANPLIAPEIFWLANRIAMRRSFWRGPSPPRRNIAEASSRPPDYPSALCHGPA